MSFYSSCGLASRHRAVKANASCPVGTSRKRDVPPPPPYRASTIHRSRSSVAHTITSRRANRPNLPFHHRLTITLPTSTSPPAAPRRTPDYPVPAPPQHSPYWNTCTTRPGRRDAAGMPPGCRPGTGENFLYFFKAARNGPHAPPIGHLAAAAAAARRRPGRRPSAGADSKKPSGPPRDDNAEGT
jgi:hypothetical protein